MAMTISGQTWRLNSGHTVQLVRRTMLGPNVDGPVFWEVEILEGDPVEGEMRFLVAEDGFETDAELVK